MSLHVEERTGSTSDLAMMLFGDRPPDQRLDISVNGATCMRDIFVFCVELCVLGLARAARTDTLEVTNITIDHFEWVRDRMKHIAILARLQSAPTEPIGIVATNAESWQYAPADQDLHLYECKLIDGINGVIHTVTFSPYTSESNCKK